MLRATRSFARALRPIGSRAQPARSFATTAAPIEKHSRALLPAVLALGAATGAVLLTQPKAECAWYDFLWGGKKEDPKWSNARAAILALIESDPNFGPLLVRLAWHASGTYDKASGTGGSNGATMRFPPECKWGANNGLGAARDALETIKTANPDVTYADLWTFAGAVAIEAMGGPKIPWTEGRTDKADGSACPPGGRLPDGDKDAAHIRTIFYRMGFNDQEIVALIGAHTLGFCHSDRSGYDGPWTEDPYKFDTDFFKLLLSEPWRIKLGSDPVQYENSNGTLMMLPADIALIVDSDFRKWVKVYAADKDAWFKDFAAAFGKLLVLGVPKPSA